MCDCGLVLLIIFNECYQISAYTNVICIASVVMNSGLSTCSFPPDFPAILNATQRLCGVKINNVTIS